MISDPRLLLLAYFLRMVYAGHTMSSLGLKPKDIKGLQFIRSFVQYRGRTPSLREIAEHLTYKSPRSAALLVGRLVKQGYLDRSPMGNLRLIKDARQGPGTGELVELPLVGGVPCGLPMLAEENTEAWIAVSQQLAKPGAQYFLLRAVGNSMDQRGIHDGDLLLVRRQPVADNGDRVVALLGNEATVKEFRRKDGKILLLPRSSNPKHKPIVMETDFMIQGVVIDTLPNPIDRDGEEQKA
jgi:repressor LexA